MLQTKAEAAISRARAKLILESPFFGTLSLRLVPAELPAGSQCETMATDGRALHYNASFVESLPIGQLVGVIAHEILHCALTHQCRRGSRDSELWNVACDLAINPMVTGAGFELPVGGLIDPRFAGMGAEDIYAALKRDQQQGGDAASGGAGKQPGEVWDAPGDDDAPAAPAEVADQRHDWEVATLQAAQAAKRAGKMPGGIVTIAEGIRSPAVDWREALRRYMTACRADDYSWRRPNVRHLADEHYFPSLRSEAVGEVILGIDVSGSTMEYRDAFAAEFNAVLEQTRPERVHLVYWDTVIQKAETVEPDAYPITLESPGNGGTMVSPLWQWARDNDIDPACCIVLTDLDIYGGGWGDDPGFPVLWVSTEKESAPFGEVVRIHASDI